MSDLPGPARTVSAALAGQTLAAFVRPWLPGKSWSQVRGLITARRVRVNGDLCLDPARRLKEGESVELLSRPAPQPARQQDILLRYHDAHIVVAEKPAGICTVRHPAERPWHDRRRALSPTLEDLVWWRLCRLEGRKNPKTSRSRLRIVQRLDKETSGLVVFARTVLAQRSLGRQFHRHTVIRKYLAIVPGQVTAQTIRSFLVRDRGDGRRGSTRLPGLGKEAITHVEVRERFPGHTLLSCRLETGRTHQIRIHLAELGHPLCGEKVYQRPPAGPLHKENSGPLRLALHAAELGFLHPSTGENMHWAMPLPNDLDRFLRQLRRKGKTGP